MQTKTLFLALLAVATASAAVIDTRQNNNNGCNAGNGNNNNQNNNGNNGNQNNNGNNNQNNGNNNQNGNGNQNAGGNGAGAGNGAANGAANFGTCNPSIDFVLGRPGRKADEGTFLPVDNVVAQGQQEALNPLIITNRVCDQLGNVCGANAAAVTLCRTAEDAVAALGTKDQTAADAFNSALGF